MGKNNYVVLVPEIHVEKRFVKGAETPEEAAYLATQVGDYQSEGTMYLKRAVVSEEAPLYVTNAADEQVARTITSDRDIAATRRDLNNMAKTVVIEDKPATKMQAVIRTATNDAKDAAWRVAVEETVDTVSEPLSAALMKQVGLEDNTLARNVAGKFLQTRMGKGVVSYGLAVMMPFVSRTLPAGMQQHAERMAKELRVNGIHQVAAPIVQAVTRPLRDIMIMQIEAMKSSGVMMESTELPVAAPTEEKIMVPVAAEAPAVQS